MPKIPWGYRSYVLFRRISPRTLAFHRISPPDKVYQSILFYSRQTGSEISDVRLVGRGTLAAHIKIPGERGFGSTVYIKAVRLSTLTTVIISTHRRHPLRHWLISDEVPSSGRRNLNLIISSLVLLPLGAAVYYSPLVLILLPLFLLVGHWIFLPSDHVHHAETILRARLP